MKGAFRAIQAQVWLNGKPSRMEFDIEEIMKSQATDSPVN
jgi:hypothetical protein